MTTYYSINTIVRRFFQASLHFMLNYNETVISGSFEPSQDFWGIFFGYVDILYSISSSLVRL